VGEPIGGSPRDQSTPAALGQCVRGGQVQRGGPGLAVWSRDGRGRQGAATACS